MNEQHRLLMVGTDPQAVAVARPDMEITVLLGASTKDGTPPLPPTVRTVFADDHKNVDAALNALYRAGLGTGSFDAVYAHDDPALMAAAVIGQALGARCVPPATVAVFRDKYLQKSRLREAGIPVTRAELIDDIHELPTGYRLPFPRAVVKPVAGMATQSTHVVASDAEIAAVAAQLRTAKSAARTFVVEEFVAGDEWFADGIVSAGAVRFLALGRYAQPCLSAVQQRAMVQTFTLDPETDAWAYERAEPLVRAALATLGLTDGTFHMEMFHNPDTGELTFSECAARRAGGPIRDMVRYKFGVDLAEVGPRALLEPIGDIPVTKRPGTVASTFLPLRAGVVLGYPSAEEILKLDDVLHARIFVPVGLTTPAGSPNTFFRMGEVTVNTATPEQAETRLTEIARWFSENIELLPLGSTVRELLRDPHNAGFQPEAGR